MVLPITVLTLTLGICFVAPAHAQNARRARAPLKEKTMRVHSLRVPGQWGADISPDGSSVAFAVARLAARFASGGFGHAARGGSRGGGAAELGRRPRRRSSTLRLANRGAGPSVGVRPRLSGARRTRGLEARRPEARGVIAACCAGSPASEGRENLASDGCGVR